MTKDEAKTKWCPFASNRVISFSKSDNKLGYVWTTRTPNGEPDTRCIASVCMAWRWEKVPNPDWQSNNQMAMYPPRNPYADDPAYVFSTTQGRCGLAGQQ